MPNFQTLVLCCNLTYYSTQASLVHNLIESYALLSEDNLALDVVESEIIKSEELTKFHSSDYVEFLGKAEDSDCLDELEEEAEQYGLAYDCELIENILNFSRTIVGSSITAAKLLVKKSSDVVINWCGGWHHAQR